MPAYRRISLKEYSRRVARLTAGLLLVPLGLFTSVLFFATGGPVPRAFLSVDQLGFEIDRDWIPIDENGKGSFVLLSGERPTPILTLVCPDREPPSDEDGVSIRVLEAFTLQEVSSFRCGRAEYGVLELGPDKIHAVSTSRRAARFQFWNLASCKAESPEIEEPWKDLGKEILDSSPEFHFAPDGRHLLIHCHRGANYYDLFNRHTLVLFQPRRHCSIKSCFFDTRGRPKVIVESNDLEIWDLSSNEFEMKLDESEFGKGGVIGGEASGGSGRHVATSSTCVATMFSDRDLLLIHSLEDGRILQTYCIPSRGYHRPQFSPDGRFLMFDYIQSNQPIDLPSTWHLGLDDWLEARLPLLPRMGLVDMRTGNMVLDQIGDGRCTINDDGTRLVSFTKEGRYEYDIPLRWRYFTPWALAALGGWVSLGVVWWRLRKGRHGTGLIGVALAS